MELHHQASTVNLFLRNALVLRFICSVTYFLGRFAHGVVQFAEQCGEILSCEPPLEGFGDGLVVTRECQQALRQLLQGREIVGRQDLALEDREIDFDLIEPTGVNGPVNEHQVVWIMTGLFGSAPECWSFHPPRGRTRWGRVYGPSRCADTNPRYVRPWLRNAGLAERSSSDAAKDGWRLRSAIARRWCH